MKHATIIIYATVKVDVHVSTPSSQAHTTEKHSWTVEKYTVDSPKLHSQTLQNCTQLVSPGIAQLDSRKIRDKDCNLQCAALLENQSVLPQ